MTTVKTEIFKIGGEDYTFETIYAGGQSFIYKVNGKLVTSEFWFDTKKWFNLN